MIEENRIRDKLREGRKFCSQIQELLPHEYDDFIGNELYLRSGERLFEIISQVILDICTMISANLPVETPNTYADCITVLTKKNILPNKLESRYKNIIKMRNLVVHTYAEIDYKLLFDGLRSILVDFEKFDKLIIEWLSKSDK